MLPSGQTTLGSIIRLPLKLIPSAAKMPVLSGALKGKRWIAGASTHGCWLGTYEQDKQTAFASAIHPGDVIYDLGANVGFYTLLASTLTGPTGKVFAFEPLPRNIDYLKRHIALNAAANCTVLEAAVGRSESEASFEIAAAHTMGRLSCSGSATLRVRVVSLDTLNSTGLIPPPNIIKCDIEGAEYDALLGASNLIAAHHPKIFLATHNPTVHAQCCSFLTDLGYRLTPLDGLPLADSSEIFALAHP